MKNDELKDEFENYPMNVQAAVNWWFSCLTGEEIKYDNGDQTVQLLASFLASLWQSEKTSDISEENANKFKVSLARSINDRMSSDGRCAVNVDYEPCEMLAKAGCYIGKTNMLDYPFKTAMYITKDSVEVKEGYGATYQEIWNNQGKRKIKKI